MGMGTVLQVQPDVLDAAGVRLARVAETVEGIGLDVRHRCHAAGECAGGAQLSDALRVLGRALAEALGRSAGATRQVATVTGLAAGDYRLVEEALAARWPVGGRP